MPFFGLFRPYDRSGSGVRREEKPKATPARFFQLWGRKFSQLVRLNLLFLVPILLVLALMAALEFFLPHYLMRLPESGNGIQWCRWEQFSHPAPYEMKGFWLDMWRLWAVPAPLVLLSPFWAGLSLVTRNYVREEHAFIWYDFWDAVRANWKSFLLGGAVCYLQFAVLSTSIACYGWAAQSQPLYYALLWPCVMLGLLCLFAQYYLPVMLVTFHLKWRQAYKNALIFSVVGLGRNLLLTLLLSVLVLFCSLPLLVLNLLVFSIFFGLFGCGFSMFLVNFMVYPVVERHMMQKSCEESMMDKK